MGIFQKSVIQKYLQDLDDSKVTRAFQVFQKFYGNQARLQNIERLKEESYQEGFLREIFVQVLGYTINPDPAFNLTTEFKNQTDSKKADGAILKDGKAIGVIELKSTKTTDLERIKQQAFNYKNNQPECKYVITSNFRFLRFYVDNATEYEEFNLFSISQAEFRKFFLFLNPESLLAEMPSKLKAETKFHEENISAQFYKDYSTFKQKIFNNLIQNNPDYDKLTLFKKSQKLLDRMLFIFFAEDRGLVPPNAINRIVEQWNQLKDLEAYQPLYNRFKRFFEHLNKGHKYQNYELPEYNGGLFAPDEVLDNIKIEDEILVNDSLKLSGYDFSTEIDVNILGHIFEHSLAEIEEITAELEGAPVDRQKSKRKKDGIYYTPKYITQYIVENTIGALCQEKKESLEILNVTIDDSHRKADGKISKKGEVLFHTLNEYKDWLLSLKIVDPACGSGAFLNQALDFLIEEHTQNDALINDLTDHPLGLYDTDKAILENNLFGVDLNEESVEIAKLALWLRTARKGRKLSHLNNNIKCGNSLIDDPEIAGNKAFNWEKEFPEIMANGGFDVVIGNPPYLNMTRNNTNNGWLDFYIENYESIKSANSKNIFTLFIEKSINLLKSKSMLSFIVPEGLFKTRSYNDCVKSMKKFGSVKSVITFEDWVFEDAVTGSLIFEFIKDVRNMKQKNYFFTKSRRLLSNDEKINTIVEKISNADFKTLKDITTLFKGMVIKDRINFIYNDFENTQKTPNKLLLGNCMDRYIITNNYFCNYNALTIVGGTKLLKKYDIAPRIIIRRTGDKLCCSLLLEKALTESTLYSCYIQDNSYNIYCILSILNSNLYTYFIRQKMITNKQAFPQILMTDLQDLKIPKIGNADQEPFVSNAKKIISLSNESFIKSKKFSNRIQSSFSVSKLSKRLIRFYNFGFDTFISEIKKNKVKLTLHQQDEWEEYFNEYKEKILTLQAEIDQTDHEIDQLVYQLYGLTSEEIEIVENSIK